MYDKKDVEEFFDHGDDVLPTADIIICTEKGIIAFVDQKANKCYQMQYGGIIGNGFAIMQYCTDNNNKYTNKVIWMTDMYYKTLHYNKVGEKQ